MKVNHALLVWLKSKGLFNYCKLSMTPQKLGQILSKLRKQKGISKYALYKDGKLNKGTVSAIENGTCNTESLLIYCSLIGAEISVKLLLTFIISSYPSD